LEEGRRRKSKERECDFGSVEQRKMEIERFNEMRKYTRYRIAKIYTRYNVEDGGDRYAVERMVVLVDVEDRRGAKKKSVGRSSCVFRALPGLGEGHLRQTGQREIELVGFPSLHHVYRPEMSLVIPVSFIIHYTHTTLSMA
jgi:hypothetical protein